LKNKLPIEILAAWFSENIALGNKKSRFSRGFKIFLYTSIFQKAEIKPFHLFFTYSAHVDFEEGILQTIGFKEFIPYLEKYDKNDDVRINAFVECGKTTEEPKGWSVLQSCLQELKAVTQRYSKKQQKWIKNRFLGNDIRNVPFIYPLDTTEVARWEELVSKPAHETIDCYINSKTIALKPMSKQKRLVEGFNEETTNYCSVCDRIFIGDFQWELHMKSNKHKRSRQKKRKTETLLEDQHNSDRNISG
jgi:tRNA dimethylallyltransferase